VWVRDNFKLANINGLGSLTSVGKELIFSDVPSLAPLTKLTNIGTNLIISGNFDLVNLTGLDNLANVGKDLDITENSKLVDFCALYNLFHTGTIAGVVNISKNGANTVTITPDTVTVNADQGLCSAVVSDSAIGNPVNGCLVPVTSTHTDFPAGNVF